MGAGPHVSTGNPLHQSCQHRWRGVGQHSGCAKQSSEAATACAQQKESVDSWRSLMKNNKQHRLRARGPLREGVQVQQTENITAGTAHGAEPTETPP